MNRTLLSALPAFVGALLCAPELVAQRNVIAGRDIQLQDTWALRGYVRSGTYPAGAFAVGAWTTCCNPVTNAIPFQAAMSPNHGYIHFIVARESNGRLEQISNWSFVKHTFGSSNDPSPCGNCAGPGSFSLVEVGCSDTYANSQAVNHFDLGPPSEIDPWLGTWDPQCSMFDAGNPAVAPAQACDNVRSLTSQQSSQLNAGLNNQMRLYDVDLQVQPANYFWQAGYLVPGEAESVRDNNLGSRGFTPTWNGTAWAFADIPNSFQQGTILQRWPGATITSATNGTSDGRFYVAVKVSGPINGKYHYEYAVHNRDNKRGMGAFRLPICPTAVVSNIGFHDVDRDPMVAGLRLEGILRQRYSCTERRAALRLKFQIGPGPPLQVLTVAHQRPVNPIPGNKLADLGKELEVEALNLSAAACPGPPLVGERPPLRVVEKKVLARNQPERPDHLRIEEVGVVEGAEDPVVGEDGRQPVLAIDHHPPDPAQMVEPEVVALNLTHRMTERAGQPVKHLARGVADADHPQPGQAGQRLGHEPGRIGETDEPRLGRVPFDGPRLFDHHRNRAQRLRQPTKPGRLLPGNPALDRDPFVTRPGRRPAYPEAAHHELGPGYRLFDLLRRADRDPVPGLTRYLTPQRGHHPGPLDVRIEEGYLRQPKRCPHQPVDQKRRSDSATPKYRYFAHRLNLTT